MSDPWINRLVVTGPVKNVKVFAKAATGFQSPEFGSRSKKPVKLLLSFTALYNLLPTKAQKRVPEIEDEPADLISERLVTRKNGKAEKIYRFQLSRYEPDLLLRQVSKLFPCLTFILGWVAPNVDEAASKFIRNGTILRYIMSGDRRSDIRVSKYKEWGEDCLDADWEADWLMLDEVVEHWDKARLQAAKGQRTRGQKRLK